MPDSLSSDQRRELFEVVAGLPEVQFDELRFALNPPNSVVPSGASAPGNRASALLEWVEGPTGIGLASFLEQLDQIAPNAVFKTYSLSLFLHLQPNIDALATAIETAYQLICPLREKMSADLIGKLTQLQDATRGGSPHETVHQFVALLSLPELNPEDVLRQQLRNWLEARLDDLQAVLMAVKPQLAEHQRQQVATETSHLLIYVKPGDTTAQRPVSALLIKDGSQYDPAFGTGGELLQSPGAEAFKEQVSLATLPQLVQACLKEAKGKLTTALCLHLILPLAWLNQDCDRWSLLCEMDRLAAPYLPDMRIGESVCCVVHIAERLEPTVLQYFQSSWQQKWQALNALTPETTCGAFVLGDKLSPDKQLKVALSQPNRVGLKLTQVYDDGDYIKLFGTLIATGTPAAVWMRQDQFVDEMCVATDLDKLLACKIARLPEQVKQCRSNATASDDNAHIGHHLSFLWEDPNLIPPSTQASLQMPQS